MKAKNEESFEILDYHNYIESGFCVIDDKKKKKNVNLKISPKRDKNNSSDLSRSSFRYLNEEIKININPPVKSMHCYLFLNNQEKQIITLKIKDYMFKISFNNGFVPPYNKNYYTFSFLNIIKYEKPSGGYFLQENNKIDIYTKDYRIISLKLNKKDYDELLDILNIYCLPGISSNYQNYALYFCIKNPIYDIDGWNLYNFEEELQLMGLNINESSTYRILDNSNYDFCSTYPKKLIVPKSMSDNEIKSCALFRTKKRFPTLTYYNKENSTSIWRSSQCKTGLTSNKCEEDIKLLTKISEKSSNKLLVYDPRPKVNAYANCLKGGGYENIKDYPNIKNFKVIFCDIVNIHCVSAKYKTFYQDFIYNKEIKINDSSQWYEYINQIIKSSFDIVSSINNNISILIHCSDGWDRTPQLSSLCQIILDMRYRTIRGFINLIEKDWLSFGHMFAYRNGYYHEEDLSNSFSGEELKSPIFIQWLDAVYQIVIQNYCKFEFNVNLLKFLAEEVINGKYGTFLYNSEKEREEKKASQKTVSIWSEVLRNESYFINPLYNKNDKKKIEFNEKRIKFWEEYFYRFETNNNDYTSLYNQKFNELIEENIKMKEKIKSNEDFFKEKNKKALEEIVEMIFKNRCNTSNLSEDAINLIKEYVKPYDSYVLINEGDERYYTKSIMELGLKKIKKK